METTLLGRTGITVSRLGFGGAPAGLTNYLDHYAPKDQDQRQQVIAAIHRAAELGVTYFDTAPGYGQGEGESIFGEALATVKTPVFLATKLTLTPDILETGHEAVGKVRALVEASLTRLRRDQVDLIQLHGTTYSTTLAANILTPGSILDHLTRVQEEGLVRFLGFTSEDNNPAVYRFIQTDRFDVMQIAYNLLFQHPYETTHPFGSMIEADRHHMGICTMRTLTSGLFQKWIRWVNPDDTFDYTAPLIQFVLSNPLVDVALVGMRTPQMVEANVQIAEDISNRIDLDELHSKYMPQD